MPIFKISNKSGAGKKLLEDFLNILPPTASSSTLDKASQNPHLFQIDDVYSEVPNVGLVVGGILKQ